MDSLNKFWWEKYLGNICFYFGILNFCKGDIRIGLSLGLKESSVDLVIITFGFMKFRNKTK